MQATILQTLRNGPRWAPWRWLLAIFLTVSALTRAALLLKTGAAADPGPATVLGIFGLGLLNDTIAAGYLFLPVIVVLALCPLRWRRYRVRRAFMFGSTVAWVYLLLFVAVSEWFFWGEFGTRFNFIAVDYLVYTQEVLANIWQSYPVGWTLAALGAVSVAVAWRARPRLYGSGTAPRLRSDLAAALLLIASPVAFYFMSPMLPRGVFANHYANELAMNGIYQFFHAYNNAELDYRRFYAKIEREDAYARVRALLDTDPSRRFPNADPHDLWRRAEYAEPAKPLNVVLISVESLSADFMAHFGNQEGITPELDRLADQGLLFTRLYATGTRTVRGLEALTLSVPPTPGESIVKRPHNTGLQTLGSIFAEQGYDVRFLYGGYARFDNMGAFFGGNGYTVVDRTDIPPERIHHENAWGIADEDIYTQALTEISRSYAAGRKSFTHIMTTSNHRPFTYPEGRIDLPSGISQRPGAVKYTDWAIGDFIERARRNPWFDDTVFVIVADHCASSAGKTDLPVYRYHIPLVIYSPAHVKPARIERLASQIDVPTTLLGLLQIPYHAPFFGVDLLRAPGEKPYAFVSTYENLGYVRDNRLVELAPLAKPSIRELPWHRGTPRTVPASDLTADAVAFYQVASEEFRLGRLRQIARAQDVTTRSTAEIAHAD